MPTVAIIGPGAIGCAVGGPLVETGREQVLFCGNTAFDRIHVTYPTGPAFEGPAKSVTTPQDLAPVDWVLLCVKAHQVPGTAPWLRALVGPATRVAVLQNGVEHREVVTPIIGDGSRILPVVVQIPAERTAPGVVKLTGDPHLVVSREPLGTAFQYLFNKSRLPVKTTPDFLKAMWEKMCLNSANGSITALTERDQSVLRQADAAELARQIILEAMSIARAEGATLDDSLPTRIIANLANAPGGGNSMYFDRRAGRDLEYEARNGVLVRLGKKHGIPTPVNATLYALLKNLKPRPSA
ncbi:2-dehydropantoate 2-reductase [Granulicella sibirica]|uniref:2-dehydropantoate 2-reductase n=1 Tax=Granulicella sibirica TaxID=2479048 RepID=A0A4Q0T3G7_9BACT|nr:2-dehydropantoate 2-reductase [Granulicella sibirica]RXH56076.1 2-dehydropantoate 2-reductase [Granulicella sibirica]